MMHVTEVRKSYGALEVLRGVTLEAHAGRVLGLVGPNASGKTTLMKIVLGLTRADAGAVSFDFATGGADPREWLGYMPQLTRFPENLTVRDVLALLGELRRGATRDDTLFRQFQLDGVMDQRVGTLSGGTRQKVNAACAFLFRPRLLVLDEPTAGLDPLAARVLKDAVLRARDAGAAVVITTHIVPEIEELADDLAFLCDGRLLFAGEVDELMAQEDAMSLEHALAALLREGEPMARRRGAPHRERQIPLRLVRP